MTHNPTWKSPGLAQVIAGVLLSVLSFSSFADPEIEANLGITSNYLWRGATQSADDPALSGGLDLYLDTGVYTGMWASGTDFGDGNGLEFDLYAGYEGATSIFDYDVGLIHYIYPSDGFENYDQTEFYVNLGLNSFSTGVAFTVYGQTGNDAPYDNGDVFGWVGYTFPLSESIALDLTSGYYLFDENEVLYGDNDYGYVQVDLSFHAFMLTLSKAGSQSGDDDAKVAFSWLYSFSF